MENLKEDIYNGKPSIILKERPFFSIVVPCYNSRNTLDALLTSIEDQNMNDQIEVILSDDCSTESYQDIVDEWKDTLSIRQVQTEYNFAPGNTRERGVSIAEGQWIIFADHDDEFIPDTLPKVRDALIVSRERYYAMANFYERDASAGKVIQEMKRFRNWNHAKFYNLDNFWKAYDIHFKKDLLTHEDIYISSRVNCALEYTGEKEPLYIDLFCYIWNNRPTTLSRKDYATHSFLETFFEDYVISTGYVYLEQYLNHGLDYMYTADSMIEVLLFCYFYTQGFKFHHPNDWIRKNDEICRGYLKNIKKFLGLSNKQIWDYVAQNDADQYMKVKRTAEIASGPYIEDMAFGTWLDYLHEDITRVRLQDIRRKEF